MLTVDYMILGCIEGSEEREQKERENRKRVQVKACQEVIDRFITKFGYIPGLTKEKLATLVASGLSSSDLASELARAASAMCSILLGYETISGKKIDVRTQQETRQPPTDMLCTQC